MAQMGIALIIPGQALCNPKQILLSQYTFFVPGQPKLHG